MEDLETPCGRGNLLHLAQIPQFAILRFYKA